jgi:hypothetical protein
MITMRRYRKKPVTITAAQLGESDAGHMVMWITDQGGTAWADTRSRVIIHTLEGDMRADPGDWVIRGVAGEFYSCKPDIFAATYQLVEEDP